MADAPQPSATVVLLRSGRTGPELLLLQRAPRKGSPGAWVFPGGRVEPRDVVGGDPCCEGSARAAAVRETHEEAGLRLDPSGLRPISRWITPAVSPRRFDTWFFAGVVEEGRAVRPDGVEIVDHRWLRPVQALEAYRAHQLALAPPTFVTISWFEGFRDPGEAIREVAARGVTTFRPRITSLGEGEVVMLYPGDAGYESGEPHAAGPHHRCRMVEGRLHYERDEQAGETKAGGLAQPERSKTSRS